MNVTITITDIGYAKYIDPDRPKNSRDAIVLSEKTLNRALDELAQMHEELNQ